MNQLHSMLKTVSFRWKLQKEGVTGLSIEIFFGQTFIPVIKNELSYYFRIVSRDVTYNNIKCVKRTVTKLTRYALNPYRDIIISGMKWLSLFSLNRMFPPLFQSIVDTSLFSANGVSVFRPASGAGSEYSFVWRLADLRGEPKCYGGWDGWEQTPHTPLWNGLDVFAALP